jgi:hypothetical protein
MKLACLLWFLLLQFSFIANAQNLWQEILNGNAPLSSTESSPHLKCGFYALLTAYHSQPAEWQKRVQKYNQLNNSKTLETYVSPSGHFMIHYETSGTNSIPTYDRDGNGTPDYLEFVANSFDLAWAVEIDTLGFRKPLDASGAPRETYDVFCTNLASQRLYGATLFDLADEIPGVPGNNYPSEIEISTNFSFVNYPGVSNNVVRDSMAIAVTAAHEFNHACHLSYNIWNADPQGFDAVDLWFIENSATYMEELVCDEVNDYYQYLQGFFSSTDRGLNAYSPFDRIYGQAVFNIMTSMVYGRTITREIWEEILNQQAIGASNKIFNDKGSSFQGELSRLSEWMFFTNKNALSGEFFPEATNYPSPAMNITQDYQSGLTEIFSDGLPSTAFQYLKTRINSESGLSVKLSPATNSDKWTSNYFLFDQPHSISFPANVNKQIPQEDILANGDSIFSSIVTGLSGGEAEYSLFFKTLSENISDEFFVYPNPVKPDQYVDFITFTNLPAGSTIFIFNGNGNLLVTIKGETSQNEVFWNLKTSQGQRVGSGVYIYRIVSKNFEREGKILIIQ